MTERQSKGLRFLITCTSREQIGEPCDILQFSEKQVRRAMTVIGEPTYKMKVDSALQYATNTVSEKCPKRINRIVSTAMSQVRGIVPVRMMKELVKERLGLE